MTTPPLPWSLRTVVQPNTCAVMILDAQGEVVGYCRDWQAGETIIQHMEVDLDVVETLEQQRDEAYDSYTEIANELSQCKQQLNSLTSAQSPSPTVSAPK